MKAALYNHLRTHVVLNERAGARQFHFEADPAGQGRDAARETQGHVARGIRLVFQWGGKKKKNTSLRRKIYLPLWYACLLFCFSTAVQGRESTWKPIGSHHHLAAVMLQLGEH